MLNGILLIALPMAMIGTEFQEVYHLIENEKASARRVALTDGKTSVRAALLDDGRRSTLSIDQSQIYAGGGYRLLASANFEELVLGCIGAKF